MIIILYQNNQIIKNFKIGTIITDEFGFEWEVKSLHKDVEHSFPATVIGPGGLVALTYMDAAWVQLKLYGEEALNWLVMMKRILC
jgi:hypothetical protein